MAVRCAKCNEQLLGAVNRCWRCGTEFASIPDPSNVPPIRRPPVDLAAWLQTSSAANAAGDSSASDATLGAPASQLAVATAADGVDLAESAASFFGSGPVRTGSPFAPAPTLQRLSNSAPAGSALGAAATPTQRARATVAVPIYPKNAAADGVAFGALLLGVLSATFALLLLRSDLSPLGPLITALLGLVMGLWGVYAPRRRGVAVFALLLCCLALAISSFFGAVDLYEYIYEEDPFDPSGGEPQAVAFPLKDPCPRV